MPCSYLLLAQAEYCSVCWSFAEVYGTQNAQCMQHAFSLTHAFTSTCPVGTIPTHKLCLHMPAGLVLT